MMAERKPKDPFAEFQDAPADDPFGEFSDAPQVAVPSEIPRRRGPSLADIGDQATGFRPQVEATGMTPEERQAAVAGLIPFAASLAAGPVAGGLIRGAGAVLPAAAQRVTGPLATAIESGGFRTGLGAAAPAAQRAALRTAGGAISGGLAAAPFGGEDIETGMAIGALTPAVARAVVEPFRRAPGPTQEAAREAASKAYEKIDAATVKIKPTAVNALADRLKQTAESLNYVPEVDIGVQRALDAVVNQAAKNEAISISKLEKLRRTVARKAASRTGDEGRIGNKLIEDIDSFIDQALPGTIVKDLDTARDLWKKMSQSAVVEKVIRKAEKATKSGQETSAVLRREFDKLRDSRLFAQFSSQEKDLINKLAEGTTSVNVLERTGRLFAPPRIEELRQMRGLIPLATYGGAGAISAPLAVGLGTTGYTSRAAANQLAAAQAQRLAMQARTGIPMQRLSPEFFPQAIPTIIAAQGE